MPASYVSISKRCNALRALLLFPPDTPRSPPQSRYERLVAHLVFSVANLFAVIGVGTVAFSLLEDKPWPEALYFSVVSVTTVGYESSACTTVGHGA